MTAATDRSAPDGVEVEPRSRSRFVRLYGAHPWHLVVLVLCFALTAYTALRLVDDPALLRIAVWFVAVAVVWDLVLGPLLAVGDRLLQPLARVGALNHVRVPLLASALLLLVWAPVVLQRSEDQFRKKAALSQDVFLGRWLTITAVLFAVSALLYAVGVLRRRRAA